MNDYSVTKSKCEINNSAGRLYNLLYDLLSHNGEMSEAIAECFNIEKGSIIDIHQEYINIMLLVRRVKEQLSSTSFNTHIWVKPIDRMINVFGQNTIHSRCQDFRNGLKVNETEKLLFIADVMKEEKGVANVSEKELNQLISQSEKLLDSLTNSSISFELRDVLQRNLLNIINGLSHYKYFGVEELKDAVEKAIGSTVLNHQQIRNQPENNDTLNKYFELINRIAAIITIQGSTPELQAPITQLLSQL